MNEGFKSKTFEGDSFSLTQLAQDFVQMIKDRAAGYAMAAPAMQAAPAVARVQQDAPRRNQ